MDLLKRLSQVLAERTVIVGMGNHFRNDDAAGLHIVEALKEIRLRKNLHLLNVEDVLESYLFSIADKECDNVLLLDAVDCQASPGSIVFGTLSELEDVVETVSTHKISLGVANLIFQKQGKKTYLLGISAENIDYGNTMSQTVRKSSELITKILKDIAKE